MLTSTNPHVNSVPDKISHGSLLEPPSVLKWWILQQELAPWKRLRWRVRIRTVLQVKLTEWLSWCSSWQICFRVSTVLQLDLLRWLGHHGEQARAWQRAVPQVRIPLPWRSKVVTRRSMGHVWWAYVTTGRSIGRTGDVWWGIPDVNRWGQVATAQRVSRCKVRSARPWGWHICKVQIASACADRRWVCIKPRVRGARDTGTRNGVIAGYGPWWRMPADWPGGRCCYCRPEGSQSSWFWQANGRRKQRCRLWYRGVWCSSICVPLAYRAECSPGGEP